MLCTALTRPKSSCYNCCNFIKFKGVLIMATHQGLQWTFFVSQCVENSVCILRNLSYRLENEVDRERYKDAPLPVHPSKEPEKHDPGCMAGCGTGAKKNKKKKGTARETEELPLKKEPVEGVELLWQPEIAKSYLSIMAESANPETLEGSAGAIHNLTACGWRV